MNIAVGLALILFSGIMAGCVLLPIKFIRNYRFENYWLLYGLIGTAIVPWFLAIGFTPHLFSIYSQLPWKTLFLPPVFAFSWGLASMLSGLCVSRIGLSLTYALVIGLGASAGSVVPLMYFSPETLRTSAGHSVLLGIAVMLVGLTLVTWAGRKREHSHSQVGAADSPARLPARSYGRWICLAALAGLLSAGLNFSFAFGQEISVMARHLGATGAASTYSVWSIAMLGGMIPNILYPSVLCSRHHTWKVFLASPRSDLLFAICLGLLFMGSTTLYGLGAVRMGALGTSIGWGIMQIMQIVVGNLAGLFTGEWKSAAPVTLFLLSLGIIILVAASGLMAYGNYVQVH